MTNIALIKGGKMLTNLLKKRQQKEKGFTIIEVMIVLAIGGLIMAVVLVAVPQLQRSQRNSAATAVLDRVFTEIQNYSTNNGGEYPNSNTERDNFCTRYLGKTSCFNFTGEEFINDPRTGNGVWFWWVFNRNSGPATLPDDGDARGITFYSANAGAGFSCNGEFIAAGTGARSVAAVIPLEGGAFACRDNS